MKTLNHLKSEFVRAAMLLGMMLTATTAWAQVTSQTVTYIDQDGKTQSVEAVALDGTETDIGNGWYFIDSDVTFSGDLTYKADEEINLILCDGATLKANRIEPDNSINSGIIRFYGQSQGTGEAIINENIYGLYSVTICGGNITARNIDSEQGSISIYGGTVNASVIEAYYSMYIYGGNVNATDNINSGGGNLELTGGTVTANSIKTTRADSYKPDIILKGSVVKANSYYAKRHITIGEGKTYYDESGTSYAAGDLTADQITAIAGKTLRPYKIVYGGTCGQNVNWLWGDTDGDDNFETLIITGTGEMAYYSGIAPAPWYGSRWNIKAVVIEDGVTSIGGLVFLDCTSLTSVTIPASVTKIEGWAFYYCEGLTSVTIPSGIIQNSAFCACKALTSVSISSGVSSIDKEAFSSCPAIEAITVDKRNTTYDSRNGCNAIIDTESNSLLFGCKNTVIPNDVTSIGEDAFNCCTGLTSITIPVGVTSIGEDAFNCCDGLTSITIPSSVTSIGNNAFFDCTNVTDVYCYADPDRLTWNDNNCDDFIYDYDSPAKTTVCHVAGSKFETFLSKWSTGDQGTDVNVIFMSDEIEPGGVDYLVETKTYKSGTAPEGVKTFLPVAYDLGTATVTLAEVTGAPKGMPVIYGSAKVDEKMPDLFFLNYVADGSDDDKAIQDNYDSKAKAMSEHFVITDGKDNLFTILGDIDGVTASDAIFFVLANGKFTRVSVSADDLDKEANPAKPGLLLFVLSKWEYMNMGSASSGSTNAARSIGIGEGGATAIDNGKLIIDNWAGAQWYDLQGRKIAEPTRKGLYIRNGVKVVVK